MIKIYETTFKDVHAGSRGNRKVNRNLSPRAWRANLPLQWIRGAAGSIWSKIREQHIRNYPMPGHMVPAEGSAFDDMFPTIDAFRCNQFPWQGAEMPDHGEVCGLPWHFEIEEKELHLYTYGVRFPYRFEKWIGEENGNIAMRYKVTNLSPFDFDFVYAAHCMIAGEEGAKVTFPFEHGEKCTGIFHEQNKFSYSDKMEWNGCTLPAKGDNQAYKFFFDKPIPGGLV